MNLGKIQVTRRFLQHNQVLTRQHQENITFILLHNTNIQIPLFARKTLQFLVYHTQKDDCLQHSVHPKTFPIRLPAIKTTWIDYLVSMVLLILSLLLLHPDRDTRCKHTPPVSQGDLQAQRVPPHTVAPPHIPVIAANPPHDPHGDLHALHTHPRHWGHCEGVHTHHDR